jgi:hypothetical protein
MTTAKMHYVLSTVGSSHGEYPCRRFPCALPGLAQENKHPYRARSDDPPVNLLLSTDSVSIPRLSRTRC